MEYQVSQLKDTRERLSLKHIKSLDIITREVDRIMPPTLQFFCGDAEQDDAQVDQAIRRDLESDDIFSLGQ